MSDGPDANDQLVAGTLPKHPRQSPHLRLVSGPREPGSHDVEDEAEAEAQAVNEPDFQSRIATPYEMMQALYNRAVRADPEPEALSTLSPRIDRLIGGYQRRTMTILGARSNWGKTKYTIALWVLCVLRKQRPLIIGGEDPRHLYEQRYCCQRAGIGAMAARDGKLSTCEEQGSRRPSPCPCECCKLLYALTGATDDERRVPMFLSAIGKPVEWVMKAATDLWAQWDYDFIVLDHLQQFRSAQADINRDDYARVSRTGELFDDFIKTVGGDEARGPAGLILSQFKQNLPSDQWPRRSDLRWAGQVAERADNILLGHAQPEQGGETQAERILRERQEGAEDDAPDPPLIRYIKVDKARNGLLGGKTELEWCSPTASFRLKEDEGT